MDRTSITPAWRSLLLLGLAGCATPGPDAARLAEAQRLEQRGDWRGAGEQLAAATARCRKGEADLGCRDAMIRAGDAFVRAERPLQAQGIYERALEQLPHDEASTAELQQRLAEAEATWSRLREAAAGKPPCAAVFVVRDEVEAQFTLTRSTYAVDGSPLTLELPPGAPEPRGELSLPPVEHAFTAELEVQGRGAFHGYRFRVRSRFIFECRSATRLEVVVHVTSNSQLNPSNRLADALDLFYESRRVPVEPPGKAP